MIQHLVDGILVGSYLSLGAIGLTLVMHILRFANFSHAELLSIGAYVRAGLRQAVRELLLPVLAAKIGPLVADRCAGAVDPGISMVADWACLRLWARPSGVPPGPAERGEELSMVFASFGMALGHPQHHRSDLRPVQRALFPKTSPLPLSCPATRCCW